VCRGFARAAGQAKDFLPAMNAKLDTLEALVCVRRLTVEGQPS
jgi:hypothetical protein